MAESRKSRSRSASAAAARPLLCPTCGRTHPSEERFCADCGMPLVHAERPAPDAGHPGEEARIYARKIRPEYARGELVRVAGGRNQAEAELIRNLLIEEGVPSLLRRSAGFDVPDFLAAGPRDVLVPHSGAESAREILHGAALAPRAVTTSGRQDPRHAVRLAAIVLGGGVATALVAWAALGWSA